jgi:hypothetical protein
MSVEHHLHRAKDYLARGDEYHRKAAEEILKAKETDSNLSNREIARRIGRDEKWVRNLLEWTASADQVRSSVTPYNGKYQHEKERIVRSALADPEQISDEDLLGAAEERGLHDGMAADFVFADEMDDLDEVEEDDTDGHNPLAARPRKGPASRPRSERTFADRLLRALNGVHLKWRALRYSEERVSRQEEEEILKAAARAKKAIIAIENHFGENLVDEAEQFLEERV